MSETRARWQGRISSFRPWALLLALFAALGIWLLATRLHTALSNPIEPQSVQIGKLVREEIGRNRFVTVAGTAFYAIGYEETENDRLVATFYALIDASTGDLIFVRSTRPVPAVEEEEVKITGMTRGSGSDLRTTIESDLPLLSQVGLVATPSLYIAANETPGKAGSIIPMIAGLGLVLVLCLATLFFPATVFRPCPVEPGVTPGSDEPIVKATGRFQRLKQLQPSPVTGRGTRRFREANANLIALEAQRLWVHIHHVERYSAVGIPLFRRKSDWAVFVDPSHTIDVVPGKLYTWRERWAVRFRHQRGEGKPQTLILSFDSAGAQSEALNSLEQTGFSVSSSAPTTL